MRIYLNRDWKFYFDKDDTSFVSVDLPHTVKETPFNSFDEKYLVAFDGRAREQYLIATFDDSVSEDENT